MTALRPSYQSILAVQSQGEFKEEIIRFANDLGFQYVSAMTVVDHSLTHSEFHNVDNMPSGLVEATAGRPEIYRRDPVAQHCRRSAIPIMWDQKTYVQQGLGEQWEEQAAFGYRTGITLALHMPEGRHFVLGVDRDRQLTRSSTALTRIVSELQLFAVHAQEVAMRLYPVEQRIDNRPNLTPREVEALSWTMEGKTAWETGFILGISERTVVLHLQNAMHKLGAVNKHQAVLKALKMKLIR
ncbi:MAG: LuxR family transcriptional regulator [Ideonella sp.]|nr:LuxR family transcriptional regulator [Ideonella sp.]